MLRTGVDLVDIDRVRQLAASGGRPSSIKLGPRPSRRIALAEPSAWRLDGGPKRP